MSGIQNKTLPINCTGANIDNEECLAMEKNALKQFKTIVAVVFAVVCEFDQAAQIDRIAVPFAALGIGRSKEFLLRLRLAQKGQNFRICQIMCCPECFK